MGPRLFSLVSLALLLLALCRPSAQADPPPKTGIETLVTADHEADFKKFGMKYSGFYQAADINSNPLPPFLAKFTAQMNNGVLCALEVASIKTDAKKAIYGPTPPDDVTPTESAIAKVMGLDCGTGDDNLKLKEEWKCHCQDKDTVLYCGAVKYKNDKQLDPATKVTCLDAAYNALKDLGKKELAKFYDISNIELNAKKLSDMFKLLFSESGVDKITDANTLGFDMAKFFCDAADTGVASALETLFKSDLFYSTLDRTMVLAILGAGDFTQGVKVLDETLCADTAFKSTPIGGCICKADKGFTYCIYNAIGKAFKEIEFIKCEEAAPSFNQDKKPKELPIPKELKPKDQTTPTPSGGGGTTVAPKPATSAATSILPLAPAAAAAALLLLRH